MDHFVECSAVYDMQELSQEELESYTIVSPRAEAAHNLGKSVSSLPIQSVFDPIGNAYVRQMRQKLRKMQQKSILLGKFQD